MNLFKRILTVISYAGIASSPIVASTGIGLPGAAILGAAGVAAGAWLHFLDSPKTPADVLEAAKASVALAKSVQDAKGRP